MSLLQTIAAAALALRRFHRPGTPRPLLSLATGALLLGLSQPLLARDLRFITIDAAPWASFDANGRAVGFFPDLIRELEARTGNHIAMALEPFARIDRELENGAQDCTIIIWAEGRDFIERGATLSAHPLGVIARKGVHITRYEDLPGLSISVLRGVSMGARFDADDAIRKDIDTDYLTGLRKIAHQRVDAVAGAMPTMRYLADREGFSHLLGDELPLMEVPLVLQCARRSPNLDLMPQLNAAIEGLVADGTVARLKRDHRF